MVLSDVAAAKDQRRADGGWGTMRRAAFARKFPGGSYGVDPDLRAVFH
jgi:hypothetical protein